MDYEEIIGQHFSKFYLKKDPRNYKVNLELKIALEEGILRRKTGQCERTVPFLAT
jgi:hypothetical protein